MRTILNNFSAKPTYLFLTHRSIESQRLQGIISPFILDTEIKECSYAQAYVGGLFREQGMDVVKQWLDPLFRPLVDAAYRTVRAVYLPPGPDAPAPTLQPIQQHGSSPQIYDSAKLDA